MAQAVNQNDLVNIINSMTKENDAIVNMINSISTKLANVKTFDVSQAEKVKKSIVFIGGYIQDISSMIISLKHMDDEAINLLADESIQTDEGVKQLKLVKAVNNISSIISSIDKVFKEVSQLDMGLNNILFFKLKIKKVIPNTFRLLLTEMTNIFNSIGAESETEIKKLENKFKTDYIKSITDLFSSIGALNEIKMPNIISIKLNLIIFKRNLVRIVEFINSMFDNKKTLVTASRLSNVDALSDTVKNIFDTVNVMYKDSAKMLIFGPLINRRLKKIIKGLYIGTEKNPGLVILLYEAISNEKIKAIIDKSKQLTDTNLNIRKLVADLSKILLMISLFTPFVTVSIIAIPIWRLGLSLLKGFIKQLCGVVSSINLKKFQDLKSKITLILGVINQLSIIFAQLTLFAPIVITGMIASLIWVIGLYALKWMISVINKIFKIKLITSASMKLNTLALLLHKIAMIFTQLTILLPIIVLGMVAIPIWMIGLLLLLAMIFVIKLFINIVKKAITVKSFIALITLQIFLTMLSILIIQVAITSVFAIIGVIGAVAIIAFLAAMLGIVLAMTGIGYLVLSVAPYLAPVIAGFAIILVMVTMLTLVAIMLSVLALIKLDKDKVLNSVNTVISTARAVIDGIFGSYNVNNEDGESKPWYQPVINLLGMGGDLIKAILAVPFLAYTMLSIGLITVMALQLSIVSKINLNKDQILNNVSIVIDTAMGVISAIFMKPKEEGESGENKSWFINVLKFAGGAIVNLLGAILSVYFLSYTMVSITLVLFLAAELKILQSIKLDKNLIKQNVGIVIDSALSVIAAIFTKPEDGEQKEEKGWFRSVLEFVGGNVLKLMGAVLSVYFLAYSLVSLTLLLFMAKELKTIQDLDLDPVAVNNSVSAIISAAQAVSNAINTPTTDQFNNKTGLSKLISFFAPKLSTMADAISSVGFIAITSISIGMLANIARNLNEIQNFKIETSIVGKVNEIVNTSQLVIDTVLGSQEDGLVGKIKSKLQGTAAINAIKNYKTIVEEIAEISRVSWGSIDENTVKNNKAITDNYIQFVEKINTVDIKKLETAANMFEKMADFSKSIHGNFEKLAESINEDLMPVLEELKETLNKIPEKIDTNAASVSQSISANAPISNQPSTQRGMTEQVQRENPNMSPQEVQKVVDMRLNEQARAHAQSLESKLDDLLEILTTGKACMTVITSS